MRMAFYCMLRYSDILLYICRGCQSLQKEALRKKAYDALNEVPQKGRLARTFRLDGETV